MPNPNLNDISKIITSLEDLTKSKEMVSIVDFVDELKNANNSVAHLIYCLLKIGNGQGLKVIWGKISYELDNKEAAVYLKKIIEEKDLLLIKKVADFFATYKSPSETNVNFYRWSLFCYYIAAALGDQTAIDKLRFQAKGENENLENCLFAIILLVQVGKNAKECNERLNFLGTNAQIVIEKKLFNAMGQVCVSRLEPILFEAIKSINIFSISNNEAGLVSLYMCLLDAFRYVFKNPIELHDDLEVQARLFASIIYAYTRLPDKYTTSFGDALYSLYSNKNFVLLNKIFANNVFNGLILINRHLQKIGDLALLEKVCRVLSVGYFVGYTKLIELYQNGYKATKSNPDRQMIASLCEEAMQSLFDHFTGKQVLPNQKAEDINALIQKMEVIFNGTPTLPQLNKLKGLISYRKAEGEAKNSSSTSAERLKLYSDAVNLGYLPAAIRVAEGHEMGWDGTCNVYRAITTLRDAIIKAKAAKEEDIENELLMKLGQYKEVKNYKKDVVDSVIAAEKYIENFVLKSKTPQESIGFARLRSFFSSSKDADATIAKVKNEIPDAKAEIADPGFSRDISKGTSLMGEKLPPIPPATTNNAGPDSGNSIVVESSEFAQLEIPIPQVVEYYQPEKAEISTQTDHYDEGQAELEIPLLKDTIQLLNDKVDEQKKLIAEQQKIIEKQKEELAHLTEVNVKLELNSAKTASDKMENNALKEEVLRLQNLLSQIGLLAVQKDKKQNELGVASQGMFSPK